MILTPLFKFLRLESMNIPKYFKTTNVAKFYNKTIGTEKRNRISAELLNINLFIINLYKKTIEVISYRKRFNLTTKRIRHLCFCL